MADQNIALPVLTAEQTAAVQAQIASHLAQANASGNPYAYWAQQPWMPPGYTVDASGKLSRTAPTDSRGSWLSRNLLAKPEVMIPAILSAGTLGGLAMAPAGAAASAAAPAATEASIYASPAAIASNAAAAPAAAAAAGSGTTAAAVTKAASAAAPFSWKSLVPTLIGGGIQYLASKNTADAAKTAAQQMTDASNKALAFSQGIYNDQKANQAPFINVGQGAATTLGNLMHIPTATPTATAPQAAPASSTAGAMVTMRAPDGSIKAVPAAQVSYFQQQGAQVVS